MSMGIDHNILGNKDSPFLTLKIPLFSFNCSLIFSAVLGIKGSIIWEIFFNENNKLFEDVKSGKKIQGSKEVMSELDRINKVTEQLEKEKQSFL